MKESDFVSVAARDTELEFAPKENEPSVVTFRCSIPRERRFTETFSSIWFARAPKRRTCGTPCSWRRMSREHGVDEKEKVMEAKESSQSCVIRECGCVFQECEELQILTGETEQFSVGEERRAKSRE